LDGKLALYTFPGPPNYQSVTGGDRAESVWILILNQPICAAEDLLASTAVQKPEVKEVQLILVDNAMDRSFREESVLSETVSITGTLSEAENAHHRTPIVFEVVNMERATSHRDE
jgi:hypothetical protein